MMEKDGLQVEKLKTLKIDKNAFENLRGFRIKMEVWEGITDTTWSEVIRWICKRARECEEIENEYYFLEEMLEEIFNILQKLLKNDENGKLLDDGEWEWVTMTAKKLGYL